MICMNINLNLNIIYLNNEYNQIKCKSKAIGHCQVINILSSLDASSQTDIKLIVIIFLKLWHWEYLHTPRYMSVNDI